MESKSFTLRGYRDEVLKVYVECALLRAVVADMVRGYQFPDDDDYSVEFSDGLIINLAKGSFWTDFQQRELIGSLLMAPYLEAAGFDLFSIGEMWQGPWPAFVLQEVDEPGFVLDNFMDMEAELREAMAALDLDPEQDSGVFLVTIKDGLINVTDAIEPSFEKPEFQADFSQFWGGDDSD